MSLTTIKLQPLTEQHLSEVIKLDQLCFGGLWSLDGYKKEIESPNSTLLIITTDIKNEE